MLPCTLGGCMDVIQYSAQVGRLDLISVLGRVFAFLNLRMIARSVVVNEAREQAKKVANEYLEKELPSIIIAPVLVYKISKPISRNSPHSFLNSSQQLMQISINSCSMCWIFLLYFFSKKDYDGCYLPNSN